ncbi:MAG: four helix bundle protein [Chthoniobacterales bacterium]
MQKKAQNYKDLVVWQKAIALAKAIYQLTSRFPSEEKFGLVAQMRRAAVSIPSNIAEGQARHTTGEFIQFISHAEGSTAELETQLILSVELGFSAKEQNRNDFILLDDIRRMLNGLRRKLSAAP